MLSVARSRFHLLAQLAFLVANGCGVILGVVYSHQTPNLYENEKHGAIGWVGTLIASTWLLASFVTASAGYRPKGQQSRHSATLSSRFNGHRSIAQTRWAGNSGHGTGSNSSSSSSDTIWEPQQFGYEQPSYESDDTEENVEDIEERSLLRRSSVGRFFSHRIGRFSGSKWTLRFIRMIKTVLDRVMLLFGFLCIVTGTVVYGGIFVSSFSLGRPNDVGH